MNLFIRTIAFLFLIQLLPFCLFAQNSRQKVESWNTKQPSRFTENKGQVTDQNGNQRNDVKYIYSAPGFKAIFKENGFSYEVFTVEKKPKQISEATGKSADELFSDKFKQPEDVNIKSHRIDINLPGANPHPQIIAEGKSADYNNYYLAHTPEEGVQKVHSFMKLTFKNIWPDIDLVFYAKKEGELKYDIVVHPGGELENIAFIYNGAGNLNLENGKLNLQTELGTLEESIPISYTKPNLEKINIRYLKDENTITFKGNYDKNKTLVIDPVIGWGTYVGGELDDIFYKLSTDKNGSIYIGGYTYSSTNIATSGVYQQKFAMGTVIGSDAMVIKFNTEGRKIWGTYYGGHESDVIHHITNDPIGSIYISGTTSSDSSIATSSAHQKTFGGKTDLFLAKLDSAGTRLWGTYYGGSGFESGGGISCDNAGSVYLTGGTNSSTNISTTGAHQTTFGTINSIFVVKFNSAGVRQWGTYYGGPVFNHIPLFDGGTRGRDVICDSDGNIYVGGMCDYQGMYSKGEDALLIKFDSSGKKIWQTMYGGYVLEYCEGIALDKANNIYMVGSTSSTDNISTSNAHQKSHGGGRLDGFLAKFDSSGTRKWSTYLGGTDDESIADIVTDNKGNILLIGTTLSSNGIATPGAHDTSFTYVYDSMINHGGDAFITKFDSLGKRQWGTYYGGNTHDNGVGIGCDTAGNIFAVGTTLSRNNIATSNAYQPIIDTSLCNSCYIFDGFLLKLETNDVKLDSLLNIKKEICNIDSLQIVVALENLYKNSTSNIVIHALLTGPDTLMLKDSIILTGDVKDTLRFNSWFHFTKLGKYKLKVYPYTWNDNYLNDTLISDLIVNKLAQFDAVSSCKDTSLRFINLSPSCHPIKSYFWDFGDGDTSTLAQPVKNKYKKHGFYDVKLVVTANGISDSIIKKTAYFPKPVADFEIKNHCLDSNLIVKNKSIVPADSITKYYWSFGDGKFSTQKEPVHLYDSAGTYHLKLVVELINGCRDSMTQQINIYPKPEASYTISGICVSDSSYFENKSKIQTGKIVKYFWDFDDGDTSSSMHVAHKFKNPGRYGIKLIATSEFGCADTFIQQVQIFPATKAHFTYTNVCYGSSILFSDSSVAGLGDTIIGYSWKFPDGTSSTLKNVNKAFPDSGIYEVKLIVTSTAGCADSITKTITIYDKPTVSFTNSSNCITDPITFTNTSTVKYGSISSSFWDFGDGKTSTQANPSKTFFSTGTHKVKLVVTSSNGCKDSVTQDVEIFYKPQPIFNVSNTCEGDSVSFINTSKPGADTIISNFWEFGDGDSSAAYSPTHKYALPGTYTVSLRVTNSRGCDRTLTRNITVYPNAKAVFSANDDCINNTILFNNASTITGGSIISYHWQFGDGDVSTLKNPSHIYDSAGKYLVVLKVTTDKGCVDSVSDSITIFPLPTADFEANNICLSDEASFTNKSLQATEWLWDFGDSTTSTSENPTHKYFSAGTYMVKLKVKNINRCEDSISKQIEVYDLPESIFSVNNICVSDSFQLTDSSKGATNWFWDFGDGYTATLQHPKHKYDKAGKYTIYLTASNSNGCADIYSTQIEVYDIPKANFSALDICMTDSLQIIDSSKNATNYLWNFGDNTTSISSSPKHKYQSAGTYTITLLVSNNNGCRDSISHIIKVDSTCVWPGDANADKIVDNKDILAIGLAYTDTGSKRTDTSTIWKGNIVKNWKGNFSNGANYKHADSDGNGIVNSSDTSAITRNYTKTHSKKQNTNRGKNTDPVLKIEIQNDSLKAGDTLLAYIILGENALPAKDAYGLAFSLNYNQEYFSSVSLYYSASWLGNNIVGYTNNTNGLDIALTRTNKKNISGAGEIAELQMVLKKDVVFNSKYIALEIVDNILISANEQEIPIRIDDDSVTVYEKPNSIVHQTRSAKPEVNVYPNPFNAQTIIAYELAQPGNVNIMLYDINGRAQTLMPSTLFASGKHRFVLDANDYNMSSGVYLVKVMIDGIPVHKRIVKLE